MRVMCPPLQYNIGWFHCPKNSLCSTYSSLCCLLEPLATTDHITVSTVLPFPQGLIIGPIQYVAFSDWLVSLSNTRLNFLHVFPCLHSSFCFSTK